MVESVPDMAMQRILSVSIEHYPIAGGFTISRGTKTEASVVTCHVIEGECQGRGECVPYIRYGETLKSVHDSIEAMAPAVAAGMDRVELLARMPAGAARNALDCALWDFEAKTGTISPAAACHDGEPLALTTAYTISLGSPEQMAEAAAKAADFPLLKIKVGSDDDLARIRAVAEAAPQSRLIVDANEAWTTENVAENLAGAAATGAVLVEQPLPAGRDGILRDIARPLPVCADESVHTAGDLQDLVGLYDAVNIKLDKTGGLTAALDARRQARKLGFRIMVGCMVGTSLAMAPAVLLAQDADFVDLDGPLLLARDRNPALLYRGAKVWPPEPALWG